MAFHDRERAAAAGQRADIAALASALEVSADALLGQPAPEIQPGRQALNLHPLRTVLLDGSADDPPDIAARPVAALLALNAETDAALRKADYGTMHRALPELIGELEGHAATAGGPARDEALRQLILACGSASTSPRGFPAQTDGRPRSHTGRRRARRGVS